MDAVNNKAVVSMSVAGVGGFQFLDLSTSLFEPAFPSEAPGGFFAEISENPLIDPIRNLLLSASENNNYEIIDVTTTTAPAFFENPIAVPAGVLDSSGEDCSTGIVLAPSEFSGPSLVYIADISNPAFGPFIPGAPAGTWTAPQQVQSLSESFLSAGASGLAVAQGTHTGIVTGEFGDDAITAILLPSTSGSGAVPAIVDWVTCRIPAPPLLFSWSHGLDPHTVTA